MADQDHDRAARELAEKLTSSTTTVKLPGGPISYDPSGPCILLSSFGQCGIYLFHAEILVKSAKLSARCLYDNGFRLIDKNRVAENETPVKIEGAGLENDLKVFKHWAYHGDLGETAPTSFEQIRDMIFGCHLLSRVDGFRDCLVDRAIALTTAKYIFDLQGFENRVLRELSRWPEGFQTFILDWITRIENMPWHIYKTVMEIRMPIIQERFMKQQLEVKRNPQLADSHERPWETDRCRYHAHDEDGQCYLKAGSINVWEEDD